MKKADAERVVDNSFERLRLMLTRVVPDSSDRVSEIIETERAVARGAIRSLKCACEDGRG